MQNYITRADRVSGFLVWAVALALLVIAIASCQGPRTSQGLAELQAMENNADADGVRTEDEAKAIEAKQDEVATTRTEEESNVLGLVSTGLATLIAGMGMIRVWRGPSTKGQP